MYIHGKGIVASQTYYTSNGEQHARKAPFLILASDAGITKLYATVRMVGLSQFGAWMHGSAQIGKKRMCLSGAYGSDGLPLTAEYVDTNHMTELPTCERWLYANMGGGWNSAGNEAPVMNDVGWRIWSIRQTSKPSKMGSVYNGEPTIPLYQRDGAELCIVHGSSGGLWFLVVVDRYGMTSWPIVTRTTPDSYPHVSWDNLNPLSQRFIDAVENNAAVWERIQADLDAHERLYRELAPTVRNRKDSEKAAWELEKAKVAAEWLSDMDYVNAKWKLMHSL